MPSKPIWTRDLAIATVARFIVKQNGRIPGYEDFRRCVDGLPSLGTAKTLFGSWQRLIQAAGYPPVMKPKYKPGPGARARLSRVFRGKW